jgi:DNA-binding PadR family transcriptional regulator
MPVRVTGPILKVLGVLLAAPGEDRYGLELIRLTKLKSGTLYPLLDRLEDAGLLISRWESEAESTSGGPRRRFYRLTSSGAAEATVILNEYLPTAAFTPRFA